MNQQNRMLAGLQICIGLLVVIGSSVDAAEYRIDTQDDFDYYKEAEFQPGDTILFKRGAVFNGMFSPTGSGTEIAPIRLRAYGEGRMPVINALGENTAGIFLKNVEFWEIDGIEI
ncbi:MAG: right-handed parallel beta-helix repeat-containing protein, partial [Planctomycetota bacterium]